jgi:hypothetical protein
MDTPVVTGQPRRQLGVSFYSAGQELIVQFSLELAREDSFTPRPEELKLMEAAVAGLRYQRHVRPYLTAEPAWIDATHTRLSLGEVTSGRSLVVQQLDWILYLLQTRPIQPTGP